MKAKLDILRISAGRMDNGHEYASAIIIDDTISDRIDADRIDVGQQHAKVRIDTTDGNRLARELALSGLIPGPVECTMRTKVRSGEAVLEIVGFTQPQQAKSA